MKLLYLNSLPNYGGGEKHTWLLMRGLRERGWRVHLAAPPGSSLAEQARSDGFNVHSIAFRSKWDVSSAAAIYRLLRRERFDVVHAQEPRSSLLGLPTARLAGVPVRITTVHMLNTDRSYPPLTGPKRFLYSAIFRWVARAATGIIAVSEWNRNALQRRGIPASKLRTIYPGIDLQEFSEPQPPREPNPLATLPEAAPVVGAVGRLVQQKGLDVLLRAFPTLLDRHPDAWLVIVGDGPERQSLEALAAKLRLRERTIFAGFRRDVPALLRRFTVMAMPSHFEGLPVAPMEAYMAGVPVVATAVYGTPEVVLDGWTGLLVPPGEPGRLAAALADLLRDVSRQQAMAEAGRRLVHERFSLETMLEATDSYYRELAPASSLPAPASSNVTEVQRAGH
ncbi:MAG: glycosyltransferase family 4 protein [Dehalococcoidia bacterium]